MFGTVVGKLLPSGNDDEALNLGINVLGEGDVNFAMDVGPKLLRQVLIQRMIKASITG